MWRIYILYLIAENHMAFSNNPIGSRQPNNHRANKNMSKLLGMIKNRATQSDNVAICRECLATNNNNPKAALDTLKTAYRRAGISAPSESLKGTLLREATNRDVTVFTAFGRRRTVNVVNFIRFLPQTISGAIDLTKMDRIASGGTQDVYGLKGKASPFVIKVNRRSMDLDLPKRQKEYESMRSSYAALRHHFGDHCTVEQLLLRDMSLEGPEQQAIVSVSEFETGFSAPSKRGLHARDFQWDPIYTFQHEEAYDAMTHALFFEHGKFDEKAVLDANPKLRDLFQLIDTDLNFRGAMNDFLQNFKSYFDSTGQFLDILGKDNIFFFKNDLDQWVFKLGTVIKEETRDKLTESLNLLESDQEAFLADNTWDGPKSILNNTFVFMTALNTLGLKLGLGKIVDDQNIQTMEKIWSSIEAIGVTQKANDPALVKELIDLIKTTSDNELATVLNQIPSKPEENESSYMLLIRLIPADKQVALGKYLHSVLPLAKDSKPPFKFCRFRHMIATTVKDITGGKKVALECMRDVLNDPNRPKDIVQRIISDLLD